MNIFDRLVAMNARWVKCSAKTGQETAHISLVRSERWRGDGAVKQVEGSVHIEPLASYTLQYEGIRPLTLQVEEVQEWVEFRDYNSEWYGPTATLTYRCNRHDDCAQVRRLGSVCQGSTESICEWISRFIKQAKGRPFTLGCAREDFAKLETMVAENFKRVLRKKVRLLATDMDRHTRRFQGRHGYQHYYLW